MNAIPFGPKKGDVANVVVALIDLLGEGVANEQEEQQSGVSNQTYLFYSTMQRDAPIDTN